MHCGIFILILLAKSASKINAENEHCDESKTCSELLHKDELSAGFLVPVLDFDYIPAPFTPSNFEMSKGSNMF